MALSDFDYKLQITKEEHPILQGLITTYQTTSPQLSMLDILWNLLTDYDDIWNHNRLNPDNPKPYPYSALLYDKIDILRDLSHLAQ